MDTEGGREGGREGGKEVRMPWCAAMASFSTVDLSMDTDGEREGGRRR